MKNVLVFSLAQQGLLPVPQQPLLDVQILLCASQDHHLLPTLEAVLDDVQAIVERVPGDPMMLGFACHAALAERIGGFDHYCYVEDDLAIHDNDIFAKLDWFQAQYGPGRALLPHRFERHGHRKLYIDGDLPPSASQLLPFRDIPTLTASWLDRDVQFSLPKNPHSGCFFLTDEQMRRWAAHPTFLDRDTGFVGPLESAATLGVYGMFELYKPTLEQASFFDIEHLDRSPRQLPKTVSPTDYP